MDPREEQKSLKEDPLPYEGDETLILNRIAEIDKKIELVDASIRILNMERSDLATVRAKLIDRAISIGRVEDAVWKIEKTVSYGNRVADPVKLKSVSTEKWNLYTDSIRDKAIQDAKLLIQKAKDNLERAVNLSVADKIFGKSVVDECSTKPEMVSYKVVEKK